MNDACVPTATELLEHVRAALAPLDDWAAAVRRRSDCPDDPVYDAASMWTNVVLNVVLDLGEARGFTSYPRRLYYRKGQGRCGGNSKYDKPKPHKDDRGEYLFDACWTLYPKTDAAWLASLRQQGLPHPRLIMACECEWVAVRGILLPDAHRLLVLNDFAKLTEVTSSLKVLVFSFSDAVPFDELVGLCDVAAQPHKRDETYLLMGWHRNAVWPDRIRSMKATILPDE